jgi:pyruvate/2-oxoglutarate dehydrogenase complex dihydrolipoamide acyltransferase (E2) component
MAFEFKFPDVGEGIHEGKIVLWLVKAGDAVKVDQPIVKVETDKAVVELPSPRAGTVLEIRAAQGEVIRVGDVIVVIGDAGEKAGAPAPPGPQVPHPARIVSAPQPITASPPAGKALRPLATPHTRALARRLGVDLEVLSGSGKNGRITDEDVERAAKGVPLGPPPAPAAPAVPRLAPAPAKAQEITESGPVERIPVTHLRKVIADNMALSKHTAAHVTHVDEADVTELLALYKKAKPEVEADGKTRLTLLPFFLKAILAALKSHPLLNASYDEAKGEIVLKRYYNFGIAVDTAEGLMVPVVRDVDKKGVPEIARELADLSQRARERILNLDELRHGSFTVTNIGPIGGLFATPIIRQPELAIVGLHTVQERPAVVDGAVVPRMKMYITVSFDHRIIDGAEAARFMTDLVKLVSNPALLLARL